MEKLPKNIMKQRTKKCLCTEDEPDSGLSNIARARTDPQSISSADSCKLDHLGSNQIFSQMDKHVIFETKVRSLN